MQTHNASLPPEVGERIGPYYVYVLIDPRDRRIFYVGKGTGDRLLAHGRLADLAGDPGQSAKLRRIKDIRAAGLEPIIEVVRHGLDEEKDAFLIEAALIDCLDELTNIVAGHGTQAGRAPMDELLTRFGATSLSDEVMPPALLIRLTPRWIPFHEELEPGVFREGAGWHSRIGAAELYDAVRGWWKVSPASAQRRGVDHAVAVVNGVTRALYTIDSWVGPRDDGRWAFVGKLVVDGPVHEAYVGSLGKRVPFLEAAQNPTHYWPPTNRSGS